MKKKIFITGGAGFIGSHICQELVSSGNYDITVFDNFSNYVGLKKGEYQKIFDWRFRGIKDKVRFEKGDEDSILYHFPDIRDQAVLDQSIRDTKPDVVVHLAAIPIAPYANKHPRKGLDVNLIGTMNVLEAMRKNDVKRIIFASSSFAYGDFKEEPIRESAGLNPIDLYGAAKSAGEALIKGYSKQFGIDYTIIRPSACFAMGDINHRVTGIFVEHAVLGKPIFIEDEGKQRLDFTYVKDTAHGFVLAIESPKAINETFNVTRGEGRTIKELYEIINSIIPFKKVEYRKSKELRPRRGTLSIEKARKLLNYHPKYSLEEGIEEYITDMKEFYNM